LRSAPSNRAPDTVHCKSLASISRPRGVFLKQWFGRAQINQPQSAGTSGMRFGTDLAA
jgi:hypothetical protein